MAGGIALFTGRFAKFHKKDFFAWGFILCAFGQIFSLALTGGYVFTEWEKTLDLKPTRLKLTQKLFFLQEYLPFLLEGIIQAVPFLTLGALLGSNNRSINPNTLCN